MNEDISLTPLQTHKVGDSFTHLAALNFLQEGMSKQTRQELESMALKLAGHFGRGELHSLGPTVLHPSQEGTCT